MVSQVSLFAKLHAQDAVYDCRSFLVSVSECMVFDCLFRAIQIRLGSTLVETGCQGGAGGRRLFGLTERHEQVKRLHLCSLSCAGNAQIDSPKAAPLPSRRFERIGDVNADSVEVVSPSFDYDAKHSPSRVLI